MSLLEENFATAEQLDTHSAVKIQSMLRMLENYETRIKLNNPQQEGKRVDFELLAGGKMDDVDTCCRIKYISRNGYTLEA